MRTRREQMQAYRFVIRRIVAAVLSGEPETIDRPMRRLGLSLFASSMLAVIGLAAFGIWGWLTEQGKPPEIGELLIERGTGTIYVVLEDPQGSEARLHPVYNIASARLLLGDPVEPRDVSASSLVDEPRGPLLGIRDAPEALPDSDDLLGLPWRVCSVPPNDSSSEPTTTVVLNPGLSGGSPLGDQGLHVATVRPVDDELVEDQHYLLWNDTQLRIAMDPGVASRALGFPPHITVGRPLMNTLNRGPDLEPPQPPGYEGASGYELDGVPLTIGQVFRIAESGDSYMLTSEGLAPLGGVSLRLLGDSVSATEITAQQAAAIDPADPLELDSFLQGRELQPHRLASGQPTVCTRYEGDPETGPAGTTIEVLDSPPEELSPNAEALDLAQTDADPAPVANQVVIVGGQGMLVRAIPHAGDSSSGTLFLINDQGTKYPLAPDAPKMLGYGDAEPVPVPTLLLDLLPYGSPLSQAAAYGDLSPAEASGTGTPEPDQGG
jgi:type VII secretion protein EccB